MKKYRFFKYQNGDFEDFTQTDTLSEAVKLFKRLYPKSGGRVLEFWMSEYDPVKLKKQAVDK